MNQSLNLEHKYKCNVEEQKENEKENIKNSRKLADECISCPGIPEYIDKVLYSVIQIIKVYAEYHDLDEDQLIQERLHMDDVNSAGQVSKEDIFDMIENGNLREKMTAVCHNFYRQSCDIIIWLLYCVHVKNSAYKKLKHLLHDKMVQEKIKRTHHISSMHMDTLYKIVKEQDKTKKNGFPCRFGIFLSETLQMSNGLWYDTPVRSKRIKNNSDEYPYKVCKNDANPPLSAREMKYMNIKPTSKNVEIPWITGKMFYYACKNSYYAKIADKYGEEFYTGPSGHANYFFQLATMLKCFDLQKSVIACAAYVLNPPDHSSFEVLIEAIKYGIDYDVAKHHSHDYIRSMIKKIDSRNSAMSYDSFSISSTS